MICKKCGYQSPDNAAFCNQCGKRLPRTESRSSSDTARQSQPSNKLIIILIIVLALAVIALVTGIILVFTSGNSSKSTGWSDGTMSSDSGSTMNPSTVLPPSDTPGNTVPDTPRVSPTPKVYTRISVLNGDTLSAAPDSCTIIQKKETYLDEAVIVPDFSAWSGLTFSTSSILSSFAYFVTSCDAMPHLELLQSYVDLLESKYNYTVVQTAANAPNWYGSFDYTWTCTHNGPGAQELKIELTGITEYSTGEYINFYFSDDMIFADNGDRADGNNVASSLIAEDTIETITLSPIYSVNSGLNSITLPTVGTSEGLAFLSSPDYTAGTVLTEDDFKLYVSMSPKDVSCFLEYASVNAFPSLGFVTTTANPEYFESITFEILDTGNGYPTVYFYAVVNDQKYTRYYFEGICAPAEDAVPDYSVPEDSGGSYIPPSAGGSSNTAMCNVCGGDGWQKCYTCGGDGKVFCSLCSGTGTYRAYGQSSDCTACVDGDKRCSDCTLGEKSCEYCGGDGYY